MVGVPNCAHLPDLDVARVASNLCDRYDSQEIYTWVGTLLVAINPWRCVPIYSDDCKELFLSRRNVAQEPHIFAMAELLRTSLLTKKGHNRTLAVLSGDSGSGKTENARLICEYLSWAQKATGVESGRRELLTLIEQSNVILEAFGNARTTNNPNSSRFGKLFSLRYQRRSNGTKLALVGATLRTYLLGRGRVSFQPYGEQNFHVLYSVAGNNFSKWKCLNHGKVENTCLFPYSQVEKALNLCGVDASAVKSALESILVLGQIEFAQNRDGRAMLGTGSEECLRFVANAWEIEVESLEDILLRVPVRETMRYRTADEACRNLGILMRVAYQNVFDHIVESLTGALQGEGDSEIQILDIYGFESLSTNGLEQLCINYANEKLQFLFIQALLITEVDLYIREGILAPHLRTELQAASATLEASSIQRISTLDCIFRALHDCSYQPGDHSSRDSAFTNHVRKLTATSPKNAPNVFCFHHFAGSVAYETRDFGASNRDDLPAYSYELLRSSSLPRPENGFRKSQKPASLAHTYMSSVDKLVGTLRGEHPTFFVRCLKPHPILSTGAIERSFIQDQLRAGGIGQVLSCMAGGYPYRIPLDRFHSLIKERLHAGDLQAAKGYSKRQLVTAGMQLINFNPKSWRMGITHLFLDASSRLEIDAFAALVAKNWDSSKLIHLAKRASPSQRLQSVAITIQFCCRLREMFKIAKTTTAAIKIQSRWRGHSVRRRLRSLLRAVWRLEFKWRIGKARMAYSPAAATTEASPANPMDFWSPPNPSVAESRCSDLSDVIIELKSDEYGVNGRDDSYRLKIERERPLLQCIGQIRSRFPRHVRGNRRRRPRAAIPSSTTHVGENFGTSDDLCHRILFGTHRNQFNGQKNRGRWTTGNGK